MHILSSQRVTAVCYYLTIAYSLLLILITIRCGCFWEGHLATTGVLMKFGLIQQNGQLGLWQEELRLTLCYFWKHCNERETGVTNANSGAWKA
jgi:hypothetical protein